ncbi:MAG TPA: CarD family transcriptional regulator [Acetobacteraceae bacterium]|nr:CarD family transcriptional regulator [Acetobacteraceae bacterium]
MKKIGVAPAKAVPAKKDVPAAASKAAAPAKIVAAKPSPDKQEAKSQAVPSPAAPTPAPAASRAAPKPAATPLHAVQEKAPAPPAPAAAASAPAAASVPPPGRPMMPDRPPPRPMAKAEIFVEGDHVVYPTHGVGKVERIATEEIAGHKLELIHITFEENRMTLRVPVAKARTAGLRKLATRKLFDEALAVLKGRARIKRTMWSRRAQEYEAKINSGDPLAIAEVVRDLHRNAGQPDQSFSERQIYEAAMDRLAAELAALDKTDKLTAATKLTNFLKTVA